MIAHQLGVPLCNGKPLWSVKATAAVATGQFGSGCWIVFGGVSSFPPPLSKGLTTRILRIEAIIAAIMTSISVLMEISTSDNVIWDDSIKLFQAKEKFQKILARMRKKKWEQKLRLTCLIV
ncbi:hypothetical protein [Rhizobium gallicum]|uniref:hypothetical protein n=1 Tax=Rhizobium gallicum TaxID=56730 RepID=UPI0012EB73C7|nr:hypothetical protein [Rhizobium gallicum]